MAGCLFEILGLEPSADYTDSQIGTAYRKLALKRHPDKPGGDGEAFIELGEAYEGLQNERCRRREFSRWQRRQACRQWCEICQSAIKDDPQHHDRLWHRCCVAGCGKTGISLFDHLVDEHQFQRCGRCHAARSLRHFEIYHKWWWCSACDGFVEDEGPISRTHHLDHHLLRLCSRILYGEAEALAAHVRDQQYRKCLACPFNIVTGKLVQHLTSRHSFMACDNCPGSEDEIGDHILSAHPTSKCGECQEVHQKDRLRFHLLFVHSYQLCPDCKEAISPSSFERHVQGHVHQQLSCLYCNMSCKNKNVLQVHISRNHRKENRERKTKQSCPDCYESFGPGFMKRHRGSVSCRRRAVSKRRDK